MVDDAALKNHILGNIDLKSFGYDDEPSFSKSQGYPLIEDRT